MSSPPPLPSGRTELQPAVSMVTIPYHSTPPGVLRLRTEEYLLQAGVPAAGLGRRHLDGRIVATGSIILSAFAASGLPPLFGGSAKTFPHGDVTASVIDCFEEPLGRRLSLADLGTEPSAPRWAAAARALAGLRRPRSPWLRFRTIPPPPGSFASAPKNIFYKLASLLRVWAAATSTGVSSRLEVSIFRHLPPPASRPSSAVRRRAFRTATLRLRSSNVSRNLSVGACRLRTWPPSPRPLAPKGGAAAARALAGQLRPRSPTCGLVWMRPSRRSARPRRRPLRVHRPGLRAPATRLGPLATPTPFMARVACASARSRRRSRRQLDPRGFRPRPAVRSRRPPFV